ncbi:cupin domain-containing protein [Sphingomonas sp. CFBP 13603]|uniref:cupin domain-containing protein n=1 Tax=Sphingomonas sp. CFBP 13603 TaxID=2774040 RepID=UPI0018688AD3|nr:cupin domain-containing protein [Sphingomonas sp. CFBP 13603]MBE2992254.1 cupin domain-containing protein [Sphingomonas sp. CFBP 13603]
MTISMRTLPAPFARAATLDTTRFYMGGLMSFLTTGTETDGGLALMEYQGKPGNEPPPHIHLWENEIVYVLDGIMEMYCGDAVMLLHPGEMAFIPRGQPHAFYICSTQFRALAIVQSIGEQPVGLDAYFMQMSSPATSMTLPTDPVTYQMEDPAHAVAVAAAHGMQILSPDEAAIALPRYPGFGNADRAPLDAATLPDAVARPVRNQSLAVFGAVAGLWPLTAIDRAS